MKIVLPNIYYTKTTRNRPERSFNPFMILCGASAHSKSHLFTYINASISQE